MAAIYERTWDCGETVFRVVFRMKEGRRFCLTFASFKAANEWVQHNESWIKEDFDKAVAWRQAHYDLMRDYRTNELYGIVRKRFGKIKGVKGHGK